MIRFSAALVAVAIGVLIGGIAASKLLLVYIAIVLSAVALVALALGVVLKREELFGEGQGLAPAQAGASPVLAERAGESYDQRRSGHVTPDPSQGAAVGPGAAFAGRSQAASPQSGASWGIPVPGAWPSQTPPTAPVPAAWQAPPVPSGATASGWGAPAAGESTAAGDPAAQGGATVPRAWGTPAPSVFAPRTTDAPAAAPAAGSGSSSPNWFNPADRPASAGTPAAAPGSGASGWSWPNGDTTVPEDKAKPEDAAAPDDDDDWPTRYSWLDEEPEENETSDDKPAGAAEATWSDAAPEGNSAVPAGLADAEASEAGTDALADPGTPATAAPDAGRPEAARSDDTGADAAAGPAASADPSEPATLRLVRDPDPEPEVAEAAEVPGEQASEPSATEAGDQAPGTGLVTVVRGVPRFHQEDCVLIRFMPAGDVEKLSVTQAREAGCTPCAACQPEG